MRIRAFHGTEGASCVRKPRPELNSCSAEEEEEEEEEETEAEEEEFCL
jgi:hypothetical protein